MSKRASPPKSIKQPVRKAQLADEMNDIEYGIVEEPPTTVTVPSKEPEADHYGNLNDQISKVQSNASEFKSLIEQRKMPQQNTSSVEKIVAVSEPPPPAVEVINKEININDLELIENDVINLNKINQKLVETLCTATKIDLNYATSATDFIFYRISQEIKKFKPKRPPPIDNIYLNGCKHISLWSLHYLDSSIGRDIFTIDESFHKKIISNHKISETALVSFQCETDSVQNSASKTVIIHDDDDESFSILGMLSKEMAVKDRPAANYLKLKHKDVDLNIFECSESVANVFLSERNLIILPFKYEASLETSSSSIIERLSMVISKDILPQEIVIVGLADSNEHSLENISTIVKTEIEKIVQQLDKQITEHCKKTNISFQEQVLISNEINFNEQLKMFHPRLIFSVLNKNDKTGILKFLEKAVTPEMVKPTEVSSLESAFAALSKANHELNSVSKSDLVEIKSFKAPPKAFELVAEATCILFSQKPSYDNFKKLMNKGDFIAMLRNFDPNAVSDYAMTQLKPYIDNESFNVEYCKRISYFCSVLCQWVRAIHQYIEAKTQIDLEAMKPKKLKPETRVKNEMTILDLIHENSFTLFQWPIYYKNRGIDMEHVKVVNESIKKINFTKNQWLNINDYYKLFDDELNQTYFPSLAEKYAKCEAAKGNILFDENSLEKTIITDLVWFCKTISIILSNLKGQQNIQDLKKLIDHNSFDEIIHYLNELDFFKLINKKNDCISMISLPKKPPSSLQKEWPSNLNCIEMSRHFDLPCSLPVDLIAYVLKDSTDRNILAIWRYGILLEEDSAYILLEYSNHKIKISVRMLDGKSLFNVKNDEALNYAEFILMRYYLIVHHMLVKNNIPAESQESSENSKDEFARIKQYCIENFLVLHEDTTNKSCNSCGLHTNFTNNEKNRITELFPNFSSASFTHVKHSTSEDGSLSASTDKIPNVYYKLFINNLHHQIEPAKQIDFTYLSSFEFKFAESLGQNVEYGLKISIAMTAEKKVDGEISASFSNKVLTDNIENLIENKVIALKSSKFNSNGNFKITKDDTVRISLENKHDQSCDLVVYFNYEKILVYSLKEINKLSIRPKMFFKADKDTIEQAEFLLSYYDYSANITSIKNMNYFLNMRVEARDRKNPSICAIANIIDVNEATRQIHINFDGWNSTFNFWCDINDEDIMPAGHWNYWKAKGNIGFKKMTRYDKPKGYSKVFDWKTYLHEINAHALPFHVFNETQKNGMTAADFKDSDLLKIPLCEKSSNFSVKARKVKNKISKNLETILMTLSFSKNGKDEGTRGVVLLPSEIDSYSDWKLSFMNISSQMSLHQTCMSSNELLGKRVTYCHMIDVSGINGELGMYTPQFLSYLIFSSYVLSKAENSIIVPSWKNLINVKNQSQSETEVNTSFRGYFTKLFEILSIYYSDLEGSIDLAQLISKIPPEKSNSNEYFFTKHCYYCHLCDYNPIETVTDRIAQTGIYGKCIMQMNIFYPNGQDYTANTFVMDNKFFEHFSSLKSINITNCGLKCVADKINPESAKLLELITLTSNGLTSIPSFIQHFKNLRDITIWNSPIKTLMTGKPDVLLNFTKLESLTLANLLISSNDLSNTIEMPSNLSLVKIDNLPLSHVPFSFEKCADTLKTLLFTGIFWINLEEIGGNKALMSIDTLKDMYRDLMSTKEIEDLFRHHDLDGNNVLSAKEIYKLNAYIFKKYPRLGSLNIDREFGGFSPSLFCLHSLTTLDLSFQAITRIPDEIKGLKSLENLLLNNCAILENISSEVGGLPLTELALANCISLKTPPPEIIRRGFYSIMSYLKRLKTGSVKCQRTKLMLVGLGEAGKTSLVRALRKNYKTKNPGEEGEVEEEDEEEKPMLTDGISINDWNIPLKDQTQLTFSIWDFAGQSVYYNTHQFFLTSRAVYILVWNVRLGSEYAGLNFWLNSISCHAPGSPIFVVGTHIDQVAKYQLNEVELKQRYKKIVGFYYVSSIKHTGIPELIVQLRDTALQEKYMGEEIPAVWLEFEKSVKNRSYYESVLNYTEISSLAEECGMYEKLEILQAVRFLKDLGSIQYFERTALKDKVVINPQWIVDMMACVISVRETAIEDGKLHHKDISKIWEDYDYNFHPWMLKLTEEFDLTFPLPNQQLSLVPCLLPDQEPAFEWPDIYEIDSNKKEYKVVYSFTYLPAGLFNRLQVRLYQYADGTTMWKRGTLLKKNDHLALITHDKNETILIKVQGTKPENIIYVIHEVLEVLVNESFNGIEYDCSFPCLDCVDARTPDPHMFKISLVRRATKLKAPFLQCTKSFHLTSINEMQTLIPVDKESNIDLQLEYSIRDLKQLKNKLKYDLSIWYCADDVPKKENEKECVNPLLVVENLKKSGYSIWYSENPKEEKFEKITHAIKESKIILIGISDQFAVDEKCIQVFELAKNMMRKNCILVEFGKVNSHNWLQNPTFASVCTDYRCIIQDPGRLSHKISELSDTIDRQLGDDSTRIDGQRKVPDVFISYCWQNSIDAVKKGTKNTSSSLGWLDPRQLKETFQNNGIDAWLDINESSNSSNLFHEITKGINAAKVIVACISDEYVNSKNCVLEFRFAHCSLKRPIVKAVVGTGNEWRQHEISFLGGIYPEINCQYENSEALNQIVQNVKNELDKVKSKETKEIARPKSTKPSSDNNLASYQELYECTQRKFLRQLVQYSDSDSFKTFPRLLLVDFEEKSLVEAAIIIEEYKNRPKDEEAAAAEKNQQAKETEEAKQEQPEKEAVSKKRKIPKTVDFKLIGNLNEISNLVDASKSEYITGFRILCEHEAGWHKSKCFLPIAEDISNKYAPYLARIMSLLKNGAISTELKIFGSKDGRALINKLDTIAEKEETSIQESYLDLGKFFYQNLLNFLKDSTTENLQILGVNRCQLQNGKILWQCDDHVKQTNAQVLDSERSVNAFGQTEEKNLMLQEIHLLEQNISA